MSNSAFCSIFLPEAGATVAVNKTNFTHDMICSAGVFNLSVLSTAVPFEVFRHFGFQSGRDTEKFSADVPQARSENGLMYLPQYTNAFISARVIEQQELLAPTRCSPPR